MIDSIKIEEVQPDGTKKEINTDPAIGYHNYLVMFNSIIDLDFAIIRMIQAEFNNPKYVDQRVMNMTTKQVRGLLINRIDPNPVTVCIGDKKIADDIYSEIMNKRYSDLLNKDKYLAITGIFFLISVYVAMDNVNVTVLCTNEEEEKIVRKYHSKVKIITMKDPSELEIDDYTEFIFKNKNDVYKFKKPFKEKRVLLLNYLFNVYIDKKPYPDLALSYYLWHNGYSNVALMDTYSKNDKDYATLVLKLVKKKSENN